MKNRKTICFITAATESLHTQRLLKGICEQCKKYDYNIVVVSSTIGVSEVFNQGYSFGEKNIYELPDYSLFDGILVDTITLTTDSDRKTLNRIYELLEAKPHGPVISIGNSFADYKTVYSENEDILREMCRHIVNVHGKKDVCIITGPKGMEESENRLDIFKDELTKLGVTITDENIYYGDFWYRGGEALAEEFISGKRHMPEAVIAASDHMALGLIERLSESGIKIPDDIIVIGFEATNESALSEITLTSFESNFAKTAADAVDMIRRELEPDREIIPYAVDVSKMIYKGMSCGCDANITNTIKAFHKSLYYTTRNYKHLDVMGGADIGLLMENYVSEDLTGSETPDECLKSIVNNIYFLHPFRSLEICLRPDWLSASYESNIGKRGYPDEMLQVVSLRYENNDTTTDSFCSIDDAKLFDTSLMSPMLHDDFGQPGIFYFSALHFMSKPFGYLVLHRDLSTSYDFNLVIRNWLRMVNNALEMTRTKYRYAYMSWHDKMTGLLNRRGMYSELDRLIDRAGENDRLFVWVIDMDGLKFVNDTFGHNNGDYGIMTVGKAAQMICNDEDLCIRAGGDEFYVISVGDYPDTETDRRISAFEEKIAELSKTSDKPYPISASIGCSIGEVNIGQLDKIISMADENMYHYKVQRQRNRR